MRLERFIWNTNRREGDIMFTGLYVRPDGAGWLAYRFIQRGNVQEAVELRFSTMFDCECYAKRNNLRVVVLEENQDSLVG